MVTVGAIKSATRVIEKVRETPFAVAVKVTVRLEDTVPAVAVNVLVEEPEGTETLVGTGRTVALLLVRATVKVLVAALLRVTVQVVVCPDASVDGEQARVLRVGGATADKVKVLDPPLAVAVMMELRLAVIVPTDAVNVRLVEPAATVTEVGT